MTTVTELRPDLASLGWSAAPRDICWMDCERPGHVKYDGKRVICLCLDHAALLESGCIGGDYTGAPLPAESLAPEWPWLRIAA
jgi:hypothetical protein